MTCPAMLRSATQSNGKQYIAIGVGNGGAQAITFPPLVPEIQNTDEAAAIWVFEAP